MQMMTTQDVAAKLKVAPSTVKQWRSEGKGPPFAKINGAVRYDPEKVDAWVAERGQ